MTAAEIPPTTTVARPARPGAARPESVSGPRLIRAYSREKCGGASFDLYLLYDGPSHWPHAVVSEDARGAEPYRRAAAAAFAAMPGARAEVRVSRGGAHYVCVLVPSRSSAAGPVVVPLHP